MVKKKIRPSLKWAGEFALFEGREGKLAGALIAEECRKFARALKDIDKLYPVVGIGDTETDEAIVSYIYSLIHWG